MPRLRNEAILPSGKVRCGGTFRTQSRAATPRHATQCCVSVGRGRESVFPPTSPHLLAQPFHILFLVAARCVLCLVYTRRSRGSSLMKFKVVHFEAVCALGKWFPSVFQYLPTEIWVHSTRAKRKALKAKRVLHVELLNAFTCFPKTCVASRPLVSLCPAKLIRLCLVPLQAYSLPRSAPPRRNP